MSTLPLQRSAASSIDAMTITREPIEDLTDRVRGMAERSVDLYEIAAALESDGMTDALAGALYGHANVFEVAREVERRVTRAPIASVAEAPEVEAPWRDVTHGLLYLLPAAVFPVGLSLLHRPSLLVGVLVVGGIGWVWSGASAWLAWQYRGQERSRSAAMVMRWSAVIALPIAVVACLLLAPPTGSPEGLVEVGVVQMAFQMSSSLLMFYRRELLLFVAMVPAVVVGMGYLVAGSSWLPPALVAAAVSVTAALACGLWHTRVRLRRAEPPLLDTIRNRLPALAVVTAYTALSAAFFLHAQAQFVRGDIMVLMAFLPLVAGMGVVEWRARRFSEASKALLSTTSDTRTFVLLLRRLVLRNCGICVVAVGGLSALLVSAVWIFGAVRPATVVLAGAGTVLAVAYFVGFQLANMGRFAWLCGSFAVCFGIHFGIVQGDWWEPTPLGNALVLLAVSGLLLVLFMGALTFLMRESRNFR